MIRGKRALDDLDDQIREHLEREIQDNLARGLSPEAARQAARRKFGNVTLVKENARAVWVPVWLDQLWQDASYGLRGSRGHPVFTATAVVTLALGIGANTAIFSVINAVLLHPLPYPTANRLVRLVESIPASESRSGRPVEGPVVFLEDFDSWRAQTQTLSHLAAYEPTLMTWASREGPVRLTAARVSASTFSMLGVQPLLGRAFDTNEEQSGADAVAVLSYGAWRRHFDADSGLVGRTVTLDGRAYSILGVMPPGFDFPDRQIELWTPFVVTSPDKGGATLVSTIGRLRDGVSRDTATAEADLFARQLHASWRPSQPIGRVQVISVKDALVAPVKPALSLIAGAVGFVLLIACVNLANLLLARNDSRRGETALRRALGATRARLMQQMLTESLILAGLGGVTGTALAWGGIWLLKALAVIGDSVYTLAPFGGGSTPLPRLDGVHIDGAVVALTIGLSVFAGVCVGLIGAFPSKEEQTPLLPMARFAGLAVSPRTRMGGLLIVAEIGLTMVLLLSATLLMRSFVKLATVNTGYDPTRLLTFQVGWPKNSYSTTQRVALSEDLVTRTRALPRVRSAGFTNILPLTGGGMFLPFQVRGLAPFRDPREGPQARIVSRGYLEAMGLRLLDGRWFDDQDQPGRRPVMLVNRALVRRFFPDHNPLGTVVSSLGPVPWAIVGVVDDMRQSTLDTDPSAQFYIDVRQAPRGEPFLGPLGSAFFVVRTAGEPTAVTSDLRALVQAIDPQATLDGAMSMDQRVSDSIARPRLFAVLLGLFATVAVVLSAVGIWGVVAYSVARRTREIGIRAALGARRRDVVRLVLQQSSIAVGLGVILGLAGALVLTRYLKAMLFGLSPLDPPTFVAVSVMFVTVALLAGFVPARRAIKVDPLIAIRCE